MTPAFNGEPASSTANQRLAHGFRRSVFGFARHAIATLALISSIARSLCRMASIIIPIRVDTMTREEAAAFLLAREIKVTWRAAIVDGNVTMRGG